MNACPLRLGPKLVFGYCLYVSRYSVQSIILLICRNYFSIDPVTPGSKPNTENMRPPGKSCHVVCGFHQAPCIPWALCFTLLHLVAFKNGTRLPNSNNVILSILLIIFWGEKNTFRTELPSSIEARLQFFKFFFRNGLIFNLAILQWTACRIKSTFLWVNY